ncbi:MAG TPA: hypothetical protein VKO85_08370 [Wenzhouxiangellaceae bacterium]|nr:hypothetical protein [Wenzhouxiangellaceae bacterium]
MKKMSFASIGLPLVATLLLAGCASDPIIDDTAVDSVQYQKDLEECREVAQQVKAASTIGKSALFSAAFGAAIGAVTGSAGRGAATGAISGVGGGGLKADEEKSTVIKNCLRQRGYKVLN